MNAFSKKLLCGAVLAALPIGSALACTTGAWDNGEGSGGTETTAVAADPIGPDAVPRYSGECALRPVSGGASFVLDNTPAAEGAAAGGGGQPYRARFYVFTGSPGATTKIFSATSDDDGAGTERFSVSYNPAGNFEFTPSGSTPAEANRWYSIEVRYQDGTDIDVDVQGAASDTGADVTAGTASGTIGSALLGDINGAAGADTMAFDEFESTRSETTAIGRLCRGDAFVDGLNTYTLDDIFATVDDFLRGQGVTTAQLATGQPDYTEDGVVDLDDIFGVVEEFIDVQTGAPGNGC